MNRRFAWWTFLLPVAGLLAEGAMAAGQPVKDRATLRLNFYSYGEQAAFAYGLEKGIYAEEGIDLTILEGSGSGATVQAIGAATDRFGYADATTMAKLVSKGLPVKMIADYVQTSPLSIIYFADKGIKGPRDMEGKKVSFTAGDALHQNFPALLKINNVDKSKVQEVLLAPQSKQTAVMTGTVDAMGGYYTTQAGAIEREPIRMRWRAAPPLRFGRNGVLSGTVSHAHSAKLLSDLLSTLRVVRGTVSGA